MKTYQELYEFANKHGFCVEWDNQGQIVLYTGLISDDGQNLRKMEQKDFEKDS